MEFPGIPALPGVELREAVFMGAAQDIPPVAVPITCMPVNRLATSPGRFLSGSGRAKLLGRLSLRWRFYFSIALMASSMICPIFGVCAAVAITDRRAFGGTNKMPSEIYPSMSSPIPDKVNSHV